MQWGYFPSWAYGLQPVRNTPQIEIPESRKSPKRTHHKRKPHTDTSDISQTQMVSKQAPRLDHQAQRNSDQSAHRKRVRQDLKDALEILDQWERHRNSVTADRVLEKIGEARDDARAWRAYA